MLGTEHLPKWLLYSATSSFLCILGSFMVPIVYASFSSHREVNTKLLNYGLSLSAGSMLCTSLLKMLGSTEQANSAIVFVGFSAGCLISFILNYIVHSYTSQSLIHCAHSDEGGELISDNFDDSHLYDMQTHAHRLSHSHSHGHSNNYGFGASEVENDIPDPQHTHSHHHEMLPEHEEETTPLINHSEHEPVICATVKPKPSTSLSEYHNANDCIPVVRSATISSLPLAKCGSETKPPALCIEPNIGYDLENLAIYREQFMSKGDSTMDSLSDHGTVLHENDHRHVMETPFSKLLSIGIQTCMVICLHKFPEGFIIFYTNPPDKVSDGKPDIGFSIFLSLAVHNFIEGFAMTLPLFTALETKWHALLITVILGGGSQPLGALLGLEWYKHSSPDHSPEYATEKMDFLLSITSGFLFVISLQMFQTAVAFSDTHHHHEGEDNSTIREHHSAGTTCLKFCCVGVLLILASSALQTL
ncbi:Zn(2+) transporter ZRT3 [Kluyveromyces lactis]|uniref:KLLA0A06644p n=1 Tax=Kluyveromyces lactis (strain ATCC 8585 / CBS 2359 / DSM 70799 / NBRC 1267 / NRRL Y-1140 / WM37) TaxID=284590 RepID=Q6CXP3_KLULA|nr:uncharacterized protein KLLA0_A06644g [Kluyveromyces lactis]CAH02884.1 KLLA0A06644p [Kluyveromyces lactis]|eukprot:XP_451296.1 uncharacterized protein KLLA0_A06644g [Kluyveromyces lactis]